MKLTVADVSDLLDVSEKTVYRWLGERKLPAYRVSGQYRFTRAEILQWATANKVNVPVGAIQETHLPAQPMPTLSEAIQLGGIFYRIGGSDRESALRNVVEVVRLPDEVDREFLLQVLLAREDLGSTAMGDGIAAPHARNPVVLHVEKPLVSLCFLERPIEYGALDGKPVQALFTLITPTARTHLHLLARLSYALRDPDFKAMVLGQAGRDDLMQALARIRAELARIHGASRAAANPAQPAGVPPLAEARDPRS